MTTQQHTLIELMYKFQEARRTMSLMDTITPFSQWYRGPHKKTKNELLKRTQQLVEILHDEGPIYLSEAFDIYLKDLHTRQSITINLDDSIGIWKKEVGFGKTETYQENLSVGKMMNHQANA